jgi:hypothetical protein
MQVIPMSEGNDEYRAPGEAKRSPSTGRRSCAAIGGPRLMPRSPGSIQSWFVNSTTLASSGLTVCIAGEFVMMASRPYSRLWPERRARLRDRVAWSDGPAAPSARREKPSRLRRFSLTRLAHLPGREQPDAKHRAPRRRRRHMDCGWKMGSAS